MDSPIFRPANTGERRSREPVHKGAASGLPIFSTEPLTAVEKDALRTGALTLRHVADLLDLARGAERVTYALHAATLGVEAGQALAVIAAGLGSNR